MKQYQWAAAIGLFFAICLSNGCTPIVVKKTQNDIKDNYTFTNMTLPQSAVMPFGVADVDYNNKNQMVFFDFKTGKVHAVNNTVWDIAIAVGSRADDWGGSTQDNRNKLIYTVTNSGDYGENTRLLPIAAGKKMEDYKNKELNIVQQVCFKQDTVYMPPSQNDTDGKPVANPFYDALTNGTQYFLRVGKDDEKVRLFVIWFDNMTEVSPGKDFTLYVVPVSLEEKSNKKWFISNFGTQYTFKGTLDAKYSFNYIKLYDNRAEMITQGIPTKDAWQLLFMRTNTYAKEMGDVFQSDGIVGTSSILTNSPAGVKTAALYGWDFPEVTRVPDDTYFKCVIDGVGKGFANPFKDDPEKRRKAWYYGVNMPPTFYLSRITYVFMWEDEGKQHYAKFRPGTFYGPAGQQFYVQFRYVHRTGN